jgi:hypothetical protein
MALVRVSYDIGDGPVEHIIDPDDLPLAFFDDLEEASATGKFQPLMRAYGEYLGLTRENMRKVTVRQFKVLLEAVKQAVEVPLANA